MIMDCMSCSFMQSIDADESSINSPALWRSDQVAQRRGRSSCTSSTTAAHRRLIAFSPAGGADRHSAVDGGRSRRPDTRARSVLPATSSSHEEFAWAEAISHVPTPAHIALAGLRGAFDATAEFAVAANLGRSGA